MQADRNLALMAIGLVVAAHAGAITALLHYEPARRALAAVAPTMVSLIAPPTLEARIALGRPKHTGAPLAVPPLAARKRLSLTAFIPIPSCRCSQRQLGMKENRKMFDLVDHARRVDADQSLLAAGGTGPLTTSSIFWKLSKNQSPGEALAPSLTVLGHIFAGGLRKSLIR